MKMQSTSLVLVGFIALTAACAFTQSTSERIITEALKPSPQEHNLRVLTDEIGGRVPGTPAMQKALQWGMNAFQSAGADSVHLEAFSISVGWQEGATSVEVTSPAFFKVRAVSLAWVPATKGPQHARVVDVGEGRQEDFQKAGNVAGALLLVHSETMKTWDDLFAEYLNAPPILAEAMKGKAAAVAFMSTRENDLLYRHINNQFGTLDKIPQLMLAREDAERIARLLADGKPVTVRYNIPNQIGGPIHSSNVVAEIRGSQKPEEFVVLGAHLDSWELGTGALDNGCNAALVIDALRAIKAAGVKPRRSIRFILFTGEEQGTLGSWAYVHSHRKELDQAVAAVIFDEGTGPTTGFSLGGRKDLVTASQELMQPYKRWNADQLTTDAFIGTDNFDFLLEGIPTFVANQKEANYLVNYHASSDTFDKVDLPQLKIHTAIAASLAFALADSAQHVGPRQSRAEVEELMRDTHLDDQLKTFDMWPDWQTGKRGRAK